MNRTYGKYKVTIRDEPAYSPGSSDNPRSYDHEYCRSDEYQHSSAHGLSVSVDRESLGSTILLGVGGATGVNENSLASDGNSLYATAGDALYSLSLPVLKLNWYEKVDSATCFGVFWLQQRNRLLTWGELEIGCYSSSGKRLWGVSGPDIFTEGFEIHTNVAKVTDFNGDVFEIDLDNGELSIAGA